MSRTHPIHRLDQKDADNSFQWRNKLVIIFQYFSTQLPNANAILDYNLPLRFHNDNVYIFDSFAPTLSEFLID